MVVMAARWVALLCAAGLLILPALTRGLADHDGLPVLLIDLASHWQWLLLAGLLLMGTIAAWRQPRWALLLLAAPLPWWTAASRAPEALPGSSVLAIASANVFYGHHDAQPLLRWVMAEQPDLLVVLELSPEFAEGLVALPGYPHRQVLPQADAFGLAVLSRHPLQDTQIVTDGDGIPQIQTTLQWRGRRVALTAMHPMPPMSTHYRRSLNDKLQTLARAAQARAEPSLVVGDLNATAWAASFAGLEARGLRRSTGLAPTWPALGRGCFGIPIDHVLVSPHWAVVGSANGPDVGSDHLPILVRLALPP